MLVFILGGNGQSPILIRAKDPVAASRSLNPHGLDRSDEPDAIVVRRIVHRGRPALQGVHVPGAVFLGIAVRNGTLKGGRSWTVGSRVRRRRNIEVLLRRVRRRENQRAHRRRWWSRRIEHRHLLSAVAEGRVPIQVRLVARHLLLNSEVGRVELRERRSPLRVQPAHSRSELTDSVNGELHERERRLELAPGTRDIDGHETPSNFLNGRDGQTAKVGSTNLREESLHEEGHSVQMSNDDQRVGRAMVVLQVVHRHPEEPGPKRPEPLKLLGNRERGADLARTTEEANEMLDLSGVLLVVLEMSLHLLNLLERALESLKILGSRLAGTVVLSRGGRSRGKGAALGDEVSKLGFVLPSVHCVDHLQAS